MTTFPCRDCGTEVTWRTSKKGHRYLAQLKKWSGEETFAERCYYPAHTCTPNPEWRELAARVEAERIDRATASGEIVKGVNVTVTKGRKVAHGTTGKVFWVAPEPDGYGTIKVGFTTDAGDKIFININNLQVTPNH